MEDAGLVSGLYFVEPVVLSILKNRNTAASGFSCVVSLLVSYKA